MYVYNHYTTISKHKYLYKYTHHTLSFVLSKCVTQMLSFHSQTHFDHLRLVPSTPASDVVFVSLLYLSDVEVEDQVQGFQVDPSTEIKQIILRFTVFQMIMEL